MGEQVYSGQQASAVMTGVSVNPGWHCCGGVGHRLELQVQSWISQQSTVATVISICPGLSQVIGGETGQFTGRQMTVSVWLSHSHF